MTMKRLLQLTVLLALTSCATSAGGREGREAAWRRDGEIRIDILNHNFSDATIWVFVSNAQRERLGTVTGKTDESYVLPWDFTQPLSLEIKLLAGPRCLTRSIDVDPGDIMQLEIQAVFRETQWCVNR